LKSGIDLIILDNGLSEESKQVVLSYNENAIFRAIKKNKYNRVDMSRTHDKLKATYYKLDIFGIMEYDRIIFIDSDVTVMGDISEIFDCHKDIAACPTYSARLDRLGNGINSGVLVLNKGVINKNVYHKLIKIATRGHSMPDQKTINIFFGKSIFKLSKGYNVEKRMWKTEKHKNIWDNKKILHWVADKPWQKLEDHQNDIERSFAEIYPIWEKYYNMEWSDING
jgi:lipopolysaccharide biosynthesis glycosyltransferase